MPDTEVVIIFYDWDLVKSVTMMRNSSCFDHSRLHDTMEQGLHRRGTGGDASPSIFSTFNIRPMDVAWKK